jgi:uncharacterized integral membrane protein
VRGEAALRRAKVVGIGVLALLALVVVVQNWTAVDVHLVFFPVRAPVALLLFTAMLIGFLLGLSVAYLVSRRPKGGTKAKPPAASPTL